jgi:hypothetical protein
VNFVDYLSSNDFCIHLLICRHDLCVLPSLLSYELLAEMPEVVRGAAILGVAEEAWEVSLELHLITLFFSHLCLKE